MEKISFIYKEIQKGSGAKSFMRMGFLIYEEMCEYSASNNIQYIFLRNYEVITRHSGII